jgi:hypothetical protein
MLLRELLKKLPNSQYMRTRDAGALYDITFQGIPISIEQPVGSLRSGTDVNGEKWESQFFYPYGYIKFTTGEDQEEVDCFVGPDEDADIVYIIKQKDKDGKFDEDKVMLGFSSLEMARDAYLAHYNCQDYLGVIETMGIDEFRGKVLLRTAEFVGDILQISDLSDSNVEDLLKRGDMEATNGTRISRVGFNEYQISYKRGGTKTISQPGLWARGEKAKEWWLVPKQ